MVLLSCPLSKSTFHLIDKNALARMKPTAFLINIGRGALVDESALIEALSQGRLAGAGLDVLEREPPDPGNPLLTMRNVVITPHSLGATVENATIVAASTTSVGGELIAWRATDPYGQFLIELDCSTRRLPK